MPPTPNPQLPQSCWSPSLLNYTSATPCHHASALHSLPAAPFLTQPCHRGTSAAPHPTWTQYGALWGHGRDGLQHDVHTAHPMQNPTQQLGHHMLPHTTGWEAGVWQGGPAPCSSSNMKPSMALAQGMLQAAGRGQEAPGNLHPTQARAQWLLQLRLMQAVAEQVQPWCRLEGGGIPRLWYPLPWAVASGPQLPPAQVSWPPCP